MAGPGCPCVSLCAGWGEELSVEAGTEEGIGPSSLTAPPPTWIYTGARE